MEKLRIAINAQVVPDGSYGGIVTVLRALGALPALNNGDEEYVFVGPYEDPEWLRSMLPAGQRIVRGPKFMSPGEWKVDHLASVKRQLGSLLPFARGVKQVAPATSRAFFQSLGCDVIHFPFQSFEECGLPSIYNPHDLQHLHLPQFFTPKEIARRERIYPMACRTAHTVIVASETVKRDVVEHYGVASNKVQVIPWAPPPLRQELAPADENTTRPLQEKYDWADRPFILYPATTWEHKNHLRLLEAVAYLRDIKAMDVRVICTGFKSDFWPNIESRLRELQLVGVVEFPGFVSLSDLDALYREAQFVFVPTLFEAASAPVFEAWQRGAPVACSKVTSLPEQVGDAALLFDPFSVEAIAAALERMATNANLREDLRRRGTIRLKEFSLERMAKAYRAVYRRAAGRELSEEDRERLCMKSG